MADILEIQVLEDFTARARCDEGFLHLRRLRCRNRRVDGTHSPEYRVDMVDRPRLDAVAVALFRRASDGELEVLTRQNLRPAAYFRKDRQPAIPDGRSHLFVEELPAGLLEPEDLGEAGVRARAAHEALEEAGYEVRPERVLLLGGPIFLAPGILSEKVFLTAADVTGCVPVAIEGDGSPLEEGGRVTWWRARALLSACRTGEVQDAKTEVAVARLLDGAPDDVAALEERGVADA